MREFHESWQLELGHWQRTFTIITTKANRLIEPIHDRLPLILDEGAAEDWRNPGERDLLRLKSLPALDDNLVLSLALVNSVNMTGKNCSYRVERSRPTDLFQKARIAFMVGSSRKRKFVEEFVDVLAAAFDGVQPCVANAASSAYAEQSRSVIFG